MGENTTLWVSKPTRNRIRTVQESIGTDSADKTVTQLIDIAATEGYLDGETSDGLASADAVDRLESRLVSIEAGLDALADLEELSDVENIPAAVQHHNQDRDQDLREWVIELQRATGGVTPIPDR